MDSPRSSGTVARRRHPARGARQNTALFSAAAFIGLGAGLAVQNSVGTANSVTTVPATTVPVTTGPAVTLPIAAVPATSVPVTAASAEEFADNAPTTPAPTVAPPPPVQAQPAPRARPAPQAKTGGS